MEKHQKLMMERDERQHNFFWRWKSGGVEKTTKIVAEIDYQSMWVEKKLEFW
jgi:hypothetical protein